MTRPILSIVVPTCDRPDTLVVCLRAIAKQPNVDVEILVQDNASDTRTVAIIKAAKALDPRIVHRRSETRLSLRNNFEEGVAGASGHYISIIGDDDAFCAGAIDRIVALLKEHRPIALRWQLAAYMWPSLSDANLGYFHLHYHYFYGGWEWHDARVLAQRMMSGEMEGLWQSLQIYHGAVSRELCEETKARTGGVLFQYHIPDVYVHTALLAVAGSRKERRYIDVEHPLSVYGLSGHSNGSSWFAARGEERGESSPMAHWERAAASDTQVKLVIQNPIRCVKYHDYAALMLAGALGLHEGKGIDHERWHNDIVDEVSKNPWQYRGFTEATPSLDYEHKVIGRVLRELDHLRGANAPEPNQLKKVYPECWRWQQLCLVSAAPDRPDDVETAVDVLESIVDINLGTQEKSKITPAQFKRWQRGLRLELKEAYMSNPPCLPGETKSVAASEASSQMVVDAPVEDVPAMPPPYVQPAFENVSDFAEAAAPELIPDATYLHVPASAWNTQTTLRVPGSRWIKKTARSVRSKLSNSTKA